MRYHAISCDIICVLRPWFDRHSVTHPAQEIGRYHAISFACSDPGLTGILCADLILLRHLLVEGENAHAELPAIQTSSNPNFQQSKLPAIQTSSNPNFQQSLLAIIYASFSFLFQGEGSGSFLLLTVSS
jgi:hypothetical protein